MLRAVALVTAAAARVLGAHVAVVGALEKFRRHLHLYVVEKRVWPLCSRMMELLMENMLMPVAGFAVFVSTVLPRGFGERMQRRARARVRCVACWRGVAGQHVATASVHSAGKKLFSTMLLEHSASRRCQRGKREKPSTAV